MDPITMANLSLLTPFLLFLLVAVCLYYYNKHRHSYWSSRGIPNPPPVPLLGNMLSRSIENQHNLALRWTAKYGKLFGTYMGYTPWLAVTDARLIKQILVTDFIHFPNRIKLNLQHELWDQNLLFANDDAWRRIRTLTTPAFTSAKLRSMQPLMSRSVSKLVNYLNKVLTTSPPDGAPVNIKETIIAFSIDVIASTSFATETGELFEAENPVLTNCRNIFYLPAWKVAAGCICPKWTLRLLGIDSFFSRKPFNFLIELTRYIIRKRKECNERRNDLVQLLLDAKVDEMTLAEGNVAKLEVGFENNIAESAAAATETLPLKSPKTLTESEIIAQGIFFFSAGFETTSSTLAHCLFELARHPQLQERLHQEITSALAPFTADLTRNTPEYFETILNGIPYLDAVIKETLRLYPPVMQLLRVVETDGYELAGIRLFKGQHIEIPVSAIHYNPEYYPEPEVFNPERFMPANRSRLVPCTFLPFGVGPRNCIGVRFTYQEMKLCLVEILRCFRFDLAEATPKRLNFKLGSPVLCAADFPLQVCCRKEIC